MSANYTPVGFVNNGPPAISGPNLAHVEAGIQQVDNAKADRLVPQSPAKTTNFAAGVGKLWQVSTTATAVTATLPAGAADGGQVGFVLTAYGTGKSLTVSAAGSDLFAGSAAGTLTLQTARQMVVLQYSASLGLWFTVASHLSLAELDIRFSSSGGSGTTGALLTANLLSEIATAGASAQATARTSLGLGSAAVQAATAFEVAGAAAAAAAASAPSWRGLKDVSSPANIDGAAVVGKHNPIDTSGGARTISLPDGQQAGAMLSIEKSTSDSNAVTISGHTRGDAANVASITLVTNRQGVLYVFGSDGTWWPVATHLRLTELDARYAVAPASPAAGFMAVVGSAGSPAAVSAARPAGAASVYWICANGVTPTNSVNGDLIYNLP